MDYFDSFSTYPLTYSDEASADFHLWLHNRLNRINEVEENLEDQSPVIIDDMSHESVSLTQEEMEKWDLNLRLNDSGIQPNTTECEDAD